MYRLFLEIEHFHCIFPSSFCYSCWKFISIFLNNFNKVTLGWSWMQIHWQFVFLSQIKMERKCFKLSFFISIIESIVVKSSFSNCDELALVCKVILNSIFYWSLVFLDSSSIFKYFICSTRMDSNSNIRVI